MLLPLWVAAQSLSIKSMHTNGLESPLGVNPDEDNPGYKNVIIRPQVIDDITWVKASKDTPYGRFDVRWETADEGFNLEVNIPAGSTATVIMPAGTEHAICSGTHSLNCKL